MAKWKCEICCSEFENYQAQGFNHKIYCPLCYFKELYKREKELGEHYKHLYSEVKKQKDDVVEYIKKFEDVRAYYEYKEGNYYEYNYDSDFKNDLLRMLGEIDG